MTYEKRPHSKHARQHKRSCQCKACRIWRSRQRAARLLDRLRDIDESAA